MTSFSVTPAELVALAQQVQGSAAQIDGQLAALRARVLPVGASWTGQAHTQFEALYEEWNRSAQGLQQALQGISALLAQAGRGYDEVERQIAGSFTGR